MWYKLCVNYLLQLNKLPHKHRVKFWLSVNRIINVNRKVEMWYGVLCKHDENQFIDKLSNSLSIRCLFWSCTDLLLCCCTFTDCRTSMASWPNLLQMPQMWGIVKRKKSISNISLDIYLFYALPRDLFFVFFFTNKNKLSFCVVKNPQLLSQLHL